MGSQFKEYEYRFLFDYLIPILEEFDEAYGKENPKIHLLLTSAIQNLTDLDFVKNNMPRFVAFYEYTHFCLSFFNTSVELLPLGECAGDQIYYLLIKRMLADSDKISAEYNNGIKIFNLIRDGVFLRMKGIKSKIEELATKGEGCTLFEAINNDKKRQFHPDNAQRALISLSDNSKNTSTDHKNSPPVRGVFFNSSTSTIVKKPTNMLSIDEIKKYLIAKKGFNCKPINLNDRIWKLEIKDNCLVLSITSYSQHDENAIKNKISTTYPDNYLKVITGSKSIDYFYIFQFDQTTTQQIDSETQIFLQEEHQSQEPAALSNYCSI